MITRLVFAGLLAITSISAQESGQKAAAKKTKTDAINYFRDIEPILNSSCVFCHQAAMAAGGLRLDAPESLLQGGASGPAVVPGKAQRSLVYTRLTDTTAKRMPPVGVLTEEQLSLIRAWINLGAKVGPAPQKP
jgi:uncharacterized membrane protein